MRRKILVVDDDSGILDAFKLLLSDADYRVETMAKDGELLKEKIRVFKPDLLILDVLLSGSDGRDFCRYIKNRKETQNIPVIMISAHPDVEGSVLESGADRFLPKPFDIPILMQAIEAFI